MASKSKNPEAIKKMNSMTNIAKKLIPYMNFVYNNEESIYRELRKACTYADYNRIIPNFYKLIEAKNYIHNVGYVISEKGREMAGMISNRPPSP